MPAFFAVLLLDNKAVMLVLKLFSLFTLLLASPVLDATTVGTPTTVRQRIGYKRLGGRL